MVTTLFQRLGIFLFFYRDIRHYACKIAGTNRLAIHSHHKRLEDSSPSNS